MAQQVVFTTFLSGQILTPLSIVQLWPAMIEEILPVAIPDVQDQLNEELTQLNALLAATPNPLYNPDLIMLPITLVNDMVDTLNTFQYNYGGPYPTEYYLDVSSKLNDVLENYSIQWQINKVPPNGYYLY